VSSTKGYLQYGKKEPASGSKNYMHQPKQIGHTALDPQQEPRLPLHDIPPIYPVITDCSQCNLILCRACSNFFFLAFGF